MYRKAWLADRVFAEIANESGRAFDPIAAAACERADVHAAMMAVVTREPKETRHTSVA